MAAITASSCLACSDVGIALAAAAANSVSTCYISSSEAGGVANLALLLSFLLFVKTGIEGSSSGSSLSSS